MSTPCKPLVLTLVALDRNYPLSLTISLCNNLRLNRKITPYLYADSISADSVNMLPSPFTSRDVFIQQGEVPALLLMVTVLFGLLFVSIADLPIIKHAIIISFITDHLYLNTTIHHLGPFPYLR